MVEKSAEVCALD